MNLPSLCWGVAGFLAVATALALPPGALDTGFALPAGTDTAPTLLLPAPAGKIYVGGTFTNYAGTGRAGLARLNADGSLDAAFTLPKLFKITPPVIINGKVLIPGSTNAGTVTTALVLPDSRAVIAGGFTHVGEAARPGLAVLNLDGTPAPFNVALGKVEPDALLAGPDGTFYVSGRGFAEVNGVNHLPILRLQADGARDPGFATPTVAALGYAGTFESFLRSGPAGSFYFGARATLADFSPAYDILRVLPGGALDAGFADAGRARVVNPGLATFLSSASGQLVFTGLTAYRGAPLARTIYRLGLNGALDPAFVCNADPGALGRVVAVEADHQVLFVGTGRLLKRLQPDGSSDSSYANPAQVPVPQAALALTYFSLAPDQGLYAGGFVVGADNVTRHGVFHLLGDPAAGPTEPGLGITLTAGGVKLTWNAGFKLQRTGALPPANWQDAGGASPVTLPATETGAFFRAVPAP